MSKLGKRLVRAMEELRDAVRGGKPVCQTMVRRMKVKGKTVYVRESFTAPLKRSGR